MTSQTISISRDGRTLKAGSYSVTCLDIKSTESLCAKNSTVADLVITLDSGESIVLPSSYNNVETIHQRFLARTKRSDPIRTSKWEHPDSTKYFHYWYVQPFSLGMREKMINWTTFIDHFRFITQSLYQNNVDPNYFHFQGRPYSQIRQFFCHVCGYKINRSGHRWKHLRRFGRHPRFWRNNWSSLYLSQCRNYQSPLSRPRQTVGSNSCEQTWRVQHHGVFPLERLFHTLFSLNEKNDI